jgi:hypothetical protein
MALSFGEVCDVGVDSVCSRYELVVGGSAFRKKSTNVVGGGSRCCCLGSVSFGDDDGGCDVRAHCVVNVEDGRNPAGPVQLVHGLQNVVRMMSQRLPKRQSNPNDVAASANANANANANDGFRSRQ